MKRIIAILFTMVALVSCRGGFTASECDVIFRGEDEVMQVMSVANSADSLLLRSQSLPMSAQMVGSEELATLCRRMLATVSAPEHDGVGIAAPQVGILRRMVAVQRFDKEGAPFEFFLNPEIIATHGEKQVGGEGCLSVPDRHGKVERFQNIVLRYRDVEFVEHTETVEGFTAVIFQHEIDHLDGVLYIDREQK
ncbi:MAG: peptide deformylase [Alistipes sp.]|nr:peptide deformylase [Alistipes sp.]